MLDIKRCNTDNYKRIYNFLIFLLELICLYATSQPTQLSNHHTPPTIPTQDNPPPACPMETTPDGCNMKLVY